MEQAEGGDGAGARSGSGGHRLGGGLHLPQLRQQPLGGLEGQHRLLQQFVLLRLAEPELLEALMEVSA